VIYVSADDLVSVTGFDIVLTWDEDFVHCDSVHFHGAALPGFSDFSIDIDNDTGTIEVILLRLDRGGYSGEADSFLEIHLRPIEPGTTTVTLSNTLVYGDPFMIDIENSGVEAELSSATIIVAEPPPLVTSTTLHQNYPNPFNPGTAIRFDVAARSPVYLRIYDVGGRVVRTLINGATYEVGEWTIEWDGRNRGGTMAPSGIYFCVFEAAGVSESRKLVIVR
jgi:hypothetical protein